MGRIENHEYSVEEAFRECFDIVPDYPRDYVWTDKEVHQLLEDINEQIDAETTREYFVDTILVAPTSQKNHYEVSDGQQRLKPWNREHAAGPITHCGSIASPIPVSTSSRCE